jgi:hypothetical protein
MAESMRLCNLMLMLVGEQKKYGERERNKAWELR